MRLRITDQKNQGPTDRKDNIDSQKRRKRAVTNETNISDPDSYITGLDTAIEESLLENRLQELVSAAESLPKPVVKSEKNKSSNVFDPLIVISYAAMIPPKDITAKGLRELCHKDSDLYPVFSLVIAMLQGIKNAPGMAANFFNQIKKALPYSYFIFLQLTNDKHQTVLQLANKGTTDSKFYRELEEAKEKFQEVVQNVKRKTNDQPHSMLTFST